MGGILLGEEERQGGGESSRVESSQSAESESSSRVERIRQATEKAGSSGGKERAFVQNKLDSTE